MTVSTTREGHVAIVTFDRPPHNFADLALIEGIGAAFAALAFVVATLALRRPPMLAPEATAAPEPLVEAA